MVGTTSDKGKKWIPLWRHTCVLGEKLPTRTLSLPWEAFPFLDLRSEGLSNLASLDQTSFLLLYDRGKWKFFPRHEKFVLICILSLYTCMSPWRNYYSLYLISGMCNIFDLSQESSSGFVVNLTILFLGFADLWPYCDKILTGSRLKKISVRDS